MMAPLITAQSFQGLQRRHITKIMPVRNKEGYGQGLPQEVAEYYLISGKKRFSNASTITTTKQAKLPKRPSLMLQIPTAILPIMTTTKKAGS